MTLSGSEHASLSGDTKQLVIFLHGYGADGNDLISLSREFASILPDAHFISPNAPQPCEMSPMGKQWFSLIDRSDAAMLAGCRDANPLLNEFIDSQLEKHNLTDKDLYLVGFSQGTMMALFTALRRQNPCATIIGYSGRLVGKEVLADEITCKPPIFLAHGDADEVVPYGSMAQAADSLAALDIEIQTLTCPRIGHGIDGNGIQAALDFIAAHKD